MEEGAFTVLHERLYSYQGLLQDKSNYYTGHALSVAQHGSDSSSGENNHLDFMSLPTKGKTSKNFDLQIYTIQ